MIDNQFVRQFKIEEDPVDAFYALETMLGDVYWIEPKMGGPTSDQHVVYDWFKYLDKALIKKLQKKKTYLIYNYRNEGYSGIEYRIFDELYECLNYNIPPSQIVFVSSNLRNKQTLDTYLKETNYEPIEIFSFPFFERNVNLFFDNRVNISPLSWMKKIEKQVKANYTGQQYFCSLSRVNRTERAVGTFLLCQEQVLSNHAYISHDIIVDPILGETVDYLKENNCEYLVDKFISWNNTLPMTIDRTDFDNNWAVSDYEFLPLFNSTLFQLVNETWVKDWNDTSLFYSEKTFKSILAFQPFLIWGQPGANYALKDLGYKTYDEWFDLSFDNEPDEVERYRKILKSVGKAVEELKSLSLKDQIKWRFKNKELLLYNYEHLCKEGGTQIMLEDFLKNLG